MKRYAIRDATGTLQGFHERRDGPQGKTMPWYGPDGSDGLSGRSTASMPLYGSEEVASWPLDEAIYVTEGEKAMEALSQLGFAVLGTSCGAGVTPEVATLVPVAVGRTFVLWPDHDDPGREHMARLGANLIEAGARAVYVIDTTSLDWPDGTDAAEFVPPIPSPTDPRRVRRAQERVSEFTAQYAGPYVPRAPKVAHVSRQQRLRLVISGGGNAQRLDAETLSHRLDRVRHLTSGGYKARCPAHDDNVASLGFRDGDDGTLLVHCYAGCSFEQVMGALA